MFLLIIIIEPYFILFCLLCFNTILSPQKMLIAQTLPAIAKTFCPWDCVGCIDTNKSVVNRVDRIFILNKLLDKDMCNE